MAERKQVAGVVFSDLGQGVSFMSLDWVQEVLRDKVGFSPFPATLNLRLESEREIAIWRKIQKEVRRIEIPPPDKSFCRAQVFPVKIGGEQQGAVILPEVEDYPPDKVEVIAPVRLKDALKVQDGDQVTLEFLT